MKFSHKTLATLGMALALTLGAMSANAQIGSCDITGQLTFGYTGLDCGQPVKIDAVMTANDVTRDTELIPPVSVSFRLYYDNDALEFVGLEGGLLDTATTYSLEISTITPARVYRIVRAQNRDNTDLTGTLLTAVFNLKDGGYKPYSVAFADDTTTLTPVMGIRPSTSAEFDMLKYYYNDAIENIGEGTTPATACGVATVATEVVPLEGPCGGQFEMPIVVASNDTIQIPRAFGLRVHYDTDKLVFIDAAEGDLGFVSYGPETVVSGTEVYRDISTLGPLSGEATDPTPLCAVLTFQQLGTFPFSVIVEAVPDSSPLVSETTYKGMYVEFDNSETTDVPGVPCTNVEDWQLF